MNADSFRKLLSDPTVLNLFRCLNEVFKCDPALFDDNGKYFSTTLKFRDLEAKIQTPNPNFTADYVLQLGVAIENTKDASVQDKKTLLKAYHAFYLYLKKNQPTLIAEIIHGGNTTSTS